MRSLLRYTGGRGERRDKETGNGMTELEQGSSNGGGPEGTGPTDETGADQTELDERDDELEPAPATAAPTRPSRGAGAPAGSPSRMSVSSFPGIRRRGDRTVARPVAGRNVASVLPETPKIDDRISAIFAVAVAVALLGILAYGLLLGAGGFFTPIHKASPAPIQSAVPSVSVSPSASESPSASGSSSAAPSASGSASAAPSASASRSAAVSPSPSAS